VPSLVVVLTAWNDVNRVNGFDVSVADDVRLPRLALLQFLFIPQQHDNTQPHISHQHRKQRENVKGRQ
jgi:hypothetical protein